MLEDVSFSVRPGEVFGVMGMSGCGKSTLLKLIMGLLRPDRGEVRSRGGISRLRNGISTRSA